MPVQKGKVTAFDFNKSLATHAADETEYGMDFTRLPGGVRGVAQLIDAKLGIYKNGPNTGKQFVQFRATVVEPEKAMQTTKVLENGKVVIKGVNEVSVRGLQTSLMIPLCDTTKQTKQGEVVVTADEHVADMLNEMRKLCGDEFTADIGSEDDLEAKFSEMKVAGPHFRFSTSDSDPTPAYPNARVWENWLGSKGLEDYVPSTNGDVVDHTSDAGEPSGGEQTGEVAAAGDDVEALVEAASGDDKDAAAEAGARLTELAEAAGKTTEEIEGAADWAEVGAMITAGAEEPAAEPEPEKPWEPVKGEVYQYQTVDPKTKKPKINPKTKKPQLTECDVTAVDKKTKTVTLLNLDDKKTTYKAVKWDDLKAE